MSGAYRLYGAETSAYSTKMRSYLRYKGVEHDWRPRNQETEAELRQFSRFPTLPVLVLGGGFAVHDTTPMIEAIEADKPEPSATPADPAIAFLAAVMEEYADTWLVKAGFHYRWTRKKDQRLAAQRVVEDYYTQSPPEDRKAAEDTAIVRMLDQLRLVGLDVEGAMGAVVEKSFKRFVKLLDDHLRTHLYLFGGRPSIADFAIAGQLIQMMKDPTPAKIIEKEGEFVAKWCDFLADPKAGGPFESLDDLKGTLLPLFETEIAAAFLPWAAENLESSLAGVETFEVTIGKDALALAPLRSAARSFKDLRKKFISALEIEALRAFTDGSGATAYLLRPQALAALKATEARPLEPAADVPLVEPTEDEPSDADAQIGERKRRRRRKRGRGADTAAATDGSESSADEAGLGDSEPDEDGAETAPETAS